MNTSATDTDPLRPLPRQGNNANGQFWKKQLADPDKDAQDKADEIARKKAATDNALRTAYPEISKK